METVERYAEDLQQEKINHNLFSLAYEELKQIGAIVDDNVSLIEQYKGIDVKVLTKKGVQVYIDEKVNYNSIRSGKLINTFGLELSTLNRFKTSRIKGWFCNEELLTTHYFLLQPTLVDRVNDILEYDVCLISKRRLKEYLSNEILTKCHTDKMSAIAKMSVFDSINTSVLHSDTNKGNIWLAPTGLRLYRDKYRQDGVFLLVPWQKYKEAGGVFAHYKTKLSLYL